MRKLLAITLMAIFGLPFASALFAITPKSEATVPMCCRRNGAHHCVMAMAELGKIQGNQAARFTVMPEKCPYAPAVLSVFDRNSVGLPLAKAIYAGVVAHPAVIAQTKARLVVSKARSRQKRGPPSSSFSL